MSYIEQGSGIRLQSGTDILVVDHYIETERGYAQGPERALMSALLFDGVQSYINYFGAQTKNVKARYKEAYNWVHSDEDEYVFSFVNVCEAVGIDPDYLRLGLINICSSKEGTWKKARRNF